MREVTAKEVDTHRVQGVVEFLILTEEVAVNPDTDLLSFGMADFYHLSSEPYRGYVDTFAQRRVNIRVRQLIVIIIVVEIYRVYLGAIKLIQPLRLCE